METYAGAYPAVLAGGGRSILYGKRDACLARIWLVADADGATPYITKVLDFMPAVGQFTNTLPEYEEGDTQESMNAKVLEAIGNNKKGMVSLGGFGGYVVVGFDRFGSAKVGRKEGG